MRRLMKLSGAVLFIVVWTMRAAFAAPSWTEVTPKADSNYRYYVGRGEASSEKKAFDEAVKDAYDQAARENFPAEYSYQADIYQTESSSYLTERTVVSGISARFDGFEKEDEFIQKNKSGYSVKLLYRFSKKAIAQEKERLKHLADTPQKQQMSVVGNKADAAKGVLIVETKPVDGAAVYVDGERYGQTPVTLYGTLDAGRHTLRIDHPKYQTVTQDIIIVPGKKESVEKTLIPAFAAISVKTDPVNADVFLDGRPIGTAPLTFDRIPVDEEVTISLRHSETERMSIPVTLKKNEKRPLNIVLSEKPAKLSLFSFPKEAEVYIDKTRAGVTPLREYAVSRGSHSVTVEKEGYEPVSFSMYAKGGEDVGKTVELKAYEKAETVVAGKKTEVVTGGKDKFHRYEEIPPEKKRLSVPSGATAEDTLVEAMRWSYPSNFIQAGVSYKKDKDDVLFFVFLSFNRENYQNLFIKPLNRALKNVSENYGKVLKNASCRYEDKHHGQLMCEMNSLGGATDTVWVQSSPLEHYFWTDKAEFDTYTLLTRADGRREQIKPYEQRKLILSVFDRSGKERRIDKISLNIRKFQTYKDRNVVFMPAFEEGFESLVLIFRTSVVDVSDINRVVIQITDGTPIDDPFPPNKK